MRCLRKLVAKRHTVPLTCASCYCVCVGRHSLYHVTALNQVTQGMDLLEKVLKVDTDGSTALTFDRDDKKMKSVWRVLCADPARFLSRESILFQ